MKKEFKKLIKKWELNPNDCWGDYCLDMIFLGGESKIDVNEAEFCLKNDITLKEFLEFKEYVMNHPESDSIQQYFKSKLNVKQ